MGLSPFFVSQEDLKALLLNEVVSKTSKEIDEIFFYGTGMGVKQNVKSFTKVFEDVFHNCEVTVSDDMLGAAIAVCGNDKGIVSILGTGSSSCYYNGNKIAKSRFGLGYVLGDEGSGTYFGKKVIQHYLYDIFDEELMQKFDEKFSTSRDEILNNVYRKPFANRYIASFTMFLAENRGHYMIENIVEDGINDFIHNHIYKFSESWKVPVNFVGSVSQGFKDVIQSVCDTAGLELGNIVHKPLDGLVAYHKKNFINNNSSINS